MLLYCKSHDIFLRPVMTQYCKAVGMAKQIVNNVNILIFGNKSGFIEFVSRDDCEINYVCGLKHNKTWIKNGHSWEKLHVIDEHL